MKCFFGKIGIYTSNAVISSILEKVLGVKFQSLGSWVFSPESYRFSKKIHLDYPDVVYRLSNGHSNDLTSNIFTKLEDIFHTAKPEDGNDYIQILGRENNNRLYKWIKREYIDSYQNLDLFKVFLPKSNGTGILGEKLSNPIIGKPSIGHNQTFISIGALKTAEEADNLLKYINTKFLRLLLGSLKVTQDNKKSVWKNIPLQNFTSESDINWNTSIENIDRQLFMKYELSNEEIDFIEKMIKPMA